MIKRTLYFGNPAYLQLSNKQLLVRLPEVEQNKELSDRFKKESLAQIPIEDIGLMVLDHPRITLTQALIAQLLEHNIALVSCNAQHLPNGLFYPLESHSTQAEKVKFQLEASEPLKKQLWQQNIQSKIRNQAYILKKYHFDYEPLSRWEKEVKSGDTENREARAAAHYWMQLSTLFSTTSERFYRDREGPYPNVLFNYAYAITRAICARAICGAGLLPIMGIFHKNKYNAYALADDLMEAYRPIVDDLVIRTYLNFPNKVELDSELKKELLVLGNLDVQMNDQKRPLMLAMQFTASSLAQCFEGSQRKLNLPHFP